MPKSTGVWGIDLGQCALKALRCSLHEQSDRIVADAFDYIEYPQILSQPGTDPTEMISDAIGLFLSRNSVVGDRVAISISGQLGLARFIKLPPVEAKKIPDIVRYEAKQQIPFDLKEVVWDYQRMGGGSEQEGFALETEIGLFAVKREQVFRSLEPFLKAEIDVDVVQLAPLALYNYLLFDQMQDLPPPEEYDPDNPPPSLAVLSLGTESSDLVISNGFRVWQRSIPLGGNHFTKALTKELKLTFPKAEHLKRNATAAQDPKAVFQAMRPVFNDLLTEVQRSLAFFNSMDRSATIPRMLTLGNAIKLPGLRKYLEQNLGLEVQRVESFRGLVGSSVVAAPAFQENLGCFGVCYGLALQALHRSGLRTSLLPREIAIDRLVRRKKPWAVGAVAALLLAFTISFAGYSRAVSTVNETDWAPAEKQADELSRWAGGLDKDFKDIDGQIKLAEKSGEHLVGNVEGRVRWLEAFKAINECLPHEQVAVALSNRPPTAEEIESRKEVHISSIDCAWVENLQKDWFDKVKVSYLPPPAAAPAPDAPAAAPASAPDAAPSGPGYVLTLTGQHYHYSSKHGEELGAQFVQNQLIANLQTEQIKLPRLDGKNFDVVFLKDVGIGCPVLVNPGKVEPITLTNPNVEGAGRTVNVRIFKFVVQMYWQPTPPSKRHEIAKKQATQAAATGAPGAGVIGGK